MRRDDWRLGGLVLASAILACCGCEGTGGGSSSETTSSMTEATVKGTVRAGGKPVSRGEITFNPANVNRKVPPRTEKIKPDGTYEIRTYLGQNVVSVAKTGTNKQQQSTTARGFDVQSGDNNTYDFELP